MDRWKTMAMMSLAFTCGVAYTAACGGTDSAKADDSGSWSDGSGGGAPSPTPSSHGGARTVLELKWSVDGEECFYYVGESRISGIDCCPAGFTFVGVGFDQSGEQVCLENAT